MGSKEKMRVREAMKFDVVSVQVRGPNLIFVAGSKSTSVCSFDGELLSS